MFFTVMALNGFRVVLHLFSCSLSFDSTPPPLAVDSVADAPPPVASPLQLHGRHLARAAQRASPDVVPLLRADGSQVRARSLPVGFWRSYSMHLLRTSLLSICVAELA